MKLRAVTWNCKVGRRPKRVARMVRKIIRRERPDVIALQEAHGYIDVLRRIKGYTLVVASGRGEDRGNPMLIRNTRRVTERAPIRCETPWTGPKAGKRHDGRVFTVADVDGVRFINVHRTRPGWSRGGAAFAEEYRRLLDNAGRYDGPVVILGDQNIGTRHSDRYRNTPWALARALGAQIVTTTPGRIDYAIVQGGDGRADGGPRLGSDHSLVAFTITLREHR